MLNRSCVVVFAAPAPIVEYIQLAANFQIVTPAPVAEKVQPVPSFKRVTIQFAYQYEAPQEVLCVDVLATTRKKRVACC